MLGRDSGGRNDRGEGMVSYLAVILLVGSLAVALVTGGTAEQISSGVGDVVCRIAQAADCGGAPAGGVSTQAERAGPKSGPDVPGAGGVKGAGAVKSSGGVKTAAGGEGAAGDSGKSDGSGEGVGAFFGGVWGAIKDTGSGLKKLVTTNPVTTGTGLTKYLWENSPIPQGKKAFEACSSGDRQGCADSGRCMLTQSCLPMDMFVDPKAKQQLKDGDYSAAGGRISWNAGLMFIPIKIPGLGKLGKAGELGEGVRVGRANPSSPAFDKAMSALGQARQGKKGAAFTPDEALNLAENYRELNAAERVKFLKRLTPKELLDLYLRTGERRGNLDAEILADAPAATLRKINPNDLFIQRVGRWMRFKGKLYTEPEPSYKDIEQSDCLGTCSLMGALGSMPKAVRTMLKENPNGTITVYFGDKTKVTVTRDLPLDSAGRPLGAVVPKDGPGWPAIAEKAYAERYGGYNILDEGENPARYLEMMGAKVQPASGRRVFSVDDIAAGLKLDDGFIVAFKKHFKADPGRGIYTPHCYIVIGADTVKKTVTLANTWGTKFSQPITLTLDELETPGVIVFHGTMR
jgi:hypothetical protein